MPHEQVAPETEGVVIGNHTQKYTARNPAIRWLTERWVANLDRLFADRRFGLVVAVEVLEHLPDPERGLAELARVGRRHLVLSVPQEPVFRACNLLAGRYVRDLGNTPGHLNHWTRRGFVRFVPEVREVTSPSPWTTVWATLPDHDGVNRG